MTRLRFDEVASALPALDELRPVIDHLLATSIPDPARRWSGSGELDTAGARLVQSGNWSAAAEVLADRERAHLGRVYHAVLEAVACAERGDDAAAAAALLEAAALEEQRDRPDRAAAYAASAAHIVRTDGVPRLLAKALRRQARAERAAGRLDRAERLYVEGHDLARESGDTEGAAEGAIGAGNVLDEQGRWREAKAWFATALHLVESAGGRTVVRWHALLDLSVVTRSLGELDESDGWLRRAEDVARELDDQAAAAIIHNAWGQLHMARGEFASAVRRFRDALAAPAGAWARVNFRLNLGEALLAEGRTLDAAEEAREAEREALTAGVASKLPEVYRLLGRITAARGNVDAFVLFERALAIVRERGLPPIEEATTLQAYAYALREQEPERAREMHERAMVLYGRLGLPGARDTWAESYGLARDLPHTNPSEAAADGGLD